MEIVFTIKFFKLGSMMHTLVPYKCRCMLFTLQEKVPSDRAVIISYMIAMHESFFQSPLYSFKFHFPN